MTNDGENLFSVSRKHTSSKYNIEYYLWIHNSEYISNFSY